MNDRSYLSQGLQLSGEHRFTGNTWGNRIQLGLRLHHDYIIRDHSERLVAVESGTLNIESNSNQIVNNRGETMALSALRLTNCGLAKNGELLRVRLERYVTA